MQILTDFGKHKRKKLTYEKDYFKWILNSDFNEDIKEFKNKRVY